MGEDGGAEPPSEIAGAAIEEDGVWGPDTVVGPPLNVTSRNLTGVSCAATNVCYAVGMDSADQPYAVEDLGGVWGAAQTISTTGSVVAIDCSTSDICTAVGNGSYSIYNGFWNTHALPGIDMSAVSCVNATNCTAVGGTSYVSETGGTWGPVTALTGFPGGSASLSSVSCSAATNCTAVGFDGDTDDNGQPFYVTSSPPPTVSSVSPNSGTTAGGVTVTITGTGFVSGASVEIGQGGGTTGAIAATGVVVVSPTKITAVTGGGAKAGSFNLFVIDSGGTSAANTGDVFTYTSGSVVPTVTAVSPNTGPTAGGTAITITGTGFVSGASVEIGQGGGTIGAIAATGVVVVSPTKITAVTGGGAKPGTWNLFVSTVAGSSAPNVGDVFFYNGVPTVSCVSPNAGPVSGGTSIRITGTGFLTGATVEIGQGAGPAPSAIPATDVDVISPTEITAVTGAGAKPGTWSLYVISFGGTTPAVRADDFTYS